MFWTRPPVPLRDSVIRARAIVAALDGALVALDEAAGLVPVHPLPAELPARVRAKIDAALAAVRADDAALATAHAAEAHMAAAWGERARYATLAGRVELQVNAEARRAAHLHTALELAAERERVGAVLAAGSAGPVYRGGAPARRSGA